MEIFTTPSLQTQYLTFQLLGEEYAINIAHIIEIIGYTTITTVPTTPVWIRGVINLRGNVVPIVDLAVKFGLTSTPVTKWTCIIIVQVDLDGETTTMGVVADLASQVIELKPGEIEPTPAFGTKVRVDYLLGMGKLGKKFVLVLDIERLLSINELLTVVTLQNQEQINQEQSQEIEMESTEGLTEQ